MNLGELLKQGRVRAKEKKTSNKTYEVEKITDPLILQWMNNIKEIRNELTSIDKT